MATQRFQAANIGKVKMKFPGKSILTQKHFFTVVHQIGKDVDGLPLFCSFYYRQKNQVLCFLPSVFSGVAFKPRLVSSLIVFSSPDWAKILAAFGFPWLVKDGYFLVFQGLKSTLPCFQPSLDHPGREPVSNGYSRWPLIRAIPKGIRGQACVSRPRNGDQWPRIIVSVIMNRHVPVTVVYFPFIWFPTKLTFF